MLSGEKGQYQVMALAPVTVELAWSVLTDYDNFDQFLPTVAASQVIETDGARTVVEQIDRRRILLSMVESKIRTENVRISDSQISFRMLEGNLQYMYGHWRVDSVDWAPQFPAVVLVSQQVRAEADLGPFKTMFYNLFEASLVETMQAICKEMKHRSVS